MREDIGAGQSSPGNVSGYRPVPPLLIPTTSRDEDKDATCLFQVPLGARNRAQVPFGIVPLTDGELRADSCEPINADGPAAMGRERSHGPRVMSRDLGKVR